MSVEKLVLNEEGMELLKKDCPADDDEYKVLVPGYINPEFIQSIDPYVGKDGYLFVRVGNTEETIKEDMEDFRIRVDQHMKNRTLLGGN